jgi:hydrogenase nickel incorporation protein HypA/HybF
MHELSLLNDMLRKITDVAAEHHSERVTGVKVRLGALSHISPQHFREHFERAVAGTIIEGAQLKIVPGTDSDDAHAQEIMLESVDLLEP